MFPRLLIKLWNMCGRAGKHKKLRWNMEMDMRNGFFGKEINNPSGSWFCGRWKLQSQIYSDTWCKWENQWAKVCGFCSLSLMRSIDPSAAHQMCFGNVKSKCLSQFYVNDVILPSLSYWNVQYSILYSRDLHNDIGKMHMDHIILLGTPKSWMNHSFYLFLLFSVSTDPSKGM